MQVLEESSKLIDNINEVVSFIKTSASDSLNFAKDQAPLVVQEYLQWEFWSSLGAWALMLVIVSCLLAVSRKLYKYATNTSLYEAKYGYTTKSMQEAQVLAMCVCVILTTGSIITFMVNSCCYGGSAIKAKVAPRVVVLEKISSLLDNNKR